MRRRTFLQLLAASPLLAAAQKRGIPLGLDSYSVRAWRWKIPELFDFCTGLKLDALMLSIPGNFESLETSYLEQVRRRAAELDLRLDAAIGCISPTSPAWNPKQGSPEDYIAMSLRVARAIGARSLRAFIGNPATRPVTPHAESALAVLRKVRSRIVDSGLRLAIENHGDFEARELKAFLEAAGTDIVGCCLDTGNPIHVLEDPLFTLEILGPYTITSHIRDSIVFSHPQGAAFQWVALGDGSIQFERIVERFAQLCPGVPMHLEIITGRPPAVIPYLEEDFWKRFPDKRAHDMAGFLRLVRTGHPYLGPMVVEDSGGPIPPEFAAALKLQQKLDVERSVRYARETLGLGVRS